MNPAEYTYKIDTLALDAKQLPTLVNAMTAVIRKSLAASRSLSLDVRGDCDDVENDVRDLAYQIRRFTDGRTRALFLERLDRSTFLGDVDHYWTHLIGDMASLYSHKEIGVLSGDPATCCWVLVQNIGDNMREIFALLRELTRCDADGKEAAK